MAFHQSFLCRYAAIKVISIHDKRLAMTFWGSLLFSFLFTVFCIIKFKTYQLTDDAVSTMSIKVKGTARSVPDYGIQFQEPLFFDAIDLVHNIDSSTIAITASYFDSIRDPTSTPPVRQPKPSAYDSNGTKSINIDDLKQWTIYWRQDLFFPAFSYKTSTAVKNTNHDGFITLSQILDETEQNQNVKEITAKGAIFKISCDWKCDLDQDKCHKTFRYRRLDHGEGFNYRVKINDTKVEKRYGIKLVFATDGVAGKFNWYKLFIATGAALAYVAVIRLLTDMVLMYCVHEKLKFYNQKYDHLYQNDEGQWVMGKSLAAVDSEPPLALI
eukprot:186668_1